MERMRVPQLASGFDRVGEVEVGVATCAIRMTAAGSSARLLLEEYGIAVLVDVVGGDGWGGLVDLAAMNVVGGFVAFVNDDAEPVEDRCRRGSSCHRPRWATAIRWRCRASRASVRAWASAWPGSSSMFTAGCPRVVRVAATAPAHRREHAGGRGGRAERPEGCHHGQLAGSSPHGIRRSRRLPPCGGAAASRTEAQPDWSRLALLRLYAFARQFCMAVAGLRFAGYVRAVPQPLPRNHRLREQALDAAKLDRIVGEADRLKAAMMAGRDGWL